MHCLQADCPKLLADVVSLLLAFNCALCCCKPMPEPPQLQSCWSCCRCAAPASGLITTMRKRACLLFQLLLVVARAMRHEVLKA